MAEVETPTTLEVKTVLERPAMACGSSGTFLALVTVAAPKYSPKNRACVDLVAVLDRSGSMQGAKLDLVKRTMLHAIDELVPGDRLAVVTFDDAVETVLQPTNLDDAGKEKARDRIAHIHTGGSTNLCGGIIAGLSMLRQDGGLCGPNSGPRNDVASVLVFTDGNANVGVTGDAAITAAIARGTEATAVASSSDPADGAAGSAAARKKPSVGGSCEVLPCTINMFGYGSDVAPKLLEGIAELGNGSYHFVETADEIPGTFSSCIGGLLSVCAQHLTVRVDAADGVRVAQIRTRFAVREVTVGSSYEMRVADIQSEEKRNFLVEVELPALTAPNEAYPLLTITLTFKNAITGLDEQITAAVTVPRPEVVPQDSWMRNAEVDKQCNRVVATEAMETSASLASEGKLDQAKAILDAASARIRESVTASDPFCVALLEDIAKCKGGLQDQRSFDAYGHSYLRTCGHMHGHERHTGYTFTSSAAYATASRVTLHNTFTGLPGSGGSGGAIP